MKKFLPALIIGLILGAALGAIGYRMAVRHWGKRGYDTALVLERMGRELSLSGPQKEALKRVLEDKKEKMKGLREQAKAIHASSRVEIRGLLSAEQAAKFDEMVARREARRQRRLSGRP